VQTAEIPEKGTWHRVRVGPFSDIGQINRTRAQLLENGFTADLIKVDSKVPNQ
jgi:cell division protein FtsN